MAGAGDDVAGARAIPTFGCGGKVPPEQQAAVDEGRRQRKEWRKTATFEKVRKMFEDPGIRLDLLCYNMSQNIEDDEIEHAFRMARALKVGAISSTSTVAVARRVAPVAEKYKIVW